MLPDAPVLPVGPEAPVAPVDPVMPLLPVLPETPVTPAWHDACITHDACVNSPLQFKGAFKNTAAHGIACTEPDLAMSKQKSMAEHMVIYDRSF